MRAHRVMVLAETLLASLVHGSALLRPWHLQMGATPEELSSAMPGEDLAHFKATRAITIQAPPDEYGLRSPVG